MPRYDIDELDNRDLQSLERFARLVESTLWPWLRYRITGLDRIPDGPALYVGNHNGGMMPVDAFLFGTAIYRQLGVDYVPYGLGHEVAISMPGLHEVIVPLGAVRASHGNASRLFELGRKVMVFPGGDVDAMRPFADRNRIVFGGRRGYIRLALRHGVPILPVLTAGAHSTLLILANFPSIPPLLGIDRLLRLKAFPVALSIPWGLSVGVVPPHFPLPSRVHAEMLPPIHFDRSGDAAAADDAYVERCDLRVRTLMQEGLDQLVERRRQGGIRATIGRGLLGRW